MACNLMESRRRIIMQPHKIQVIWNNLEPAFSTELYKPYNSSNTSLEDVELGVVKQIWLPQTGNNGGYSYTTRIKDSYSVIKDHIMYVSYWIKCSQSGTAFGVEYAGGVIPSPPVIVNSNEWTRISFSDPVLKSGKYPVYYGNRRSGTACNATNGTYVLLKAPLYVDLTIMFGAGKEPDKKTFERQCIMNGIDLTQSHVQNISGTQCWWAI